MKKHVLTIVLLSITVVIMAQQEPMEMKPEMTEVWDPEVPVITPGDTSTNAPSDAIILFDGNDLSKEWMGTRDSVPGWIVEDGYFTVGGRFGDIKTKRVFEDVQLHIEWRTPVEVVGESQGRGNSGIFLQEIYEVQVLDSYNNRTYRHGQAGSIYKQYAPLVNASKGPGEWQTFDIIYIAPRFNDDGTYFTPPTVTVLHNGVLIQNNVKLRGPTEYIGIPEYSVKSHGPGSIVLQNHGNPVSYRNIWIREL
ncbi:MAG: DUF1080 domain-containing protein [Prolixibacteraceae bacterium]|nr:DUF1080 domain-containing protein [Prolixibacteraceae bacterium]